MRLTATGIRKLTLAPSTAEVIVFDDDLPGFGVRIRAGGSKTYVFQYKLGAKQRRLTLGPLTAIDLSKARDNRQRSLRKGSAWWRSSRREGSCKTQGKRDV
jgi:hypothetical protein